MSRTMLAILIILVLLGWYLSFSATRLDRLHHRVETSWEHLDALLQRRASLALEISHQSDLDPATVMLLTTSAYQSREAPMSDRSDAETSLSESLKFLRNAAQSGDADIKVGFIDELTRLTEKIRIAIAIHLEAVRAVGNLRAKTIFRLFRLAGRAKLPHRFTFEEDAL